MQTSRQRSLRDHGLSSGAHRAQTDDLLVRQVDTDFIEQIKDVLQEPEGEKFDHEPSLPVMLEIFDAERRVQTKLATFTAAPSHETF